MRRQKIKLERLDVRERAGGLEPGYARNGRVRADVDEYAVADQHPPAAVVQLHLERLRAHEPTRAHDELGAARLEVVQLPGDLVVDHFALAVADRRHVESRHDPSSRRTRRRGAPATRPWRSRSRSCWAGN